VLAKEASAQSLAPSTRGSDVQVNNSLNTDLSNCKAFSFGQLPLRYSNGGAPTRDIARGTVPTGELVELHETTVEPGMMPHPVHQHPHEEFILVREGTMDFIYGGESHILGPGGAGYTAPNQMHGFKNVGSTQATYFIFSLSKK
jgi:quercetin dioxygenase-like cupin family protein